MHKKISISVVALFLLMAMAFTQSASALEASKSVPNWDHMIIASIGEPDTVDPGKAYDTASAAIIFNVYDTLVFFKHEQIPGDPNAFDLHLADSYTIVDTTTYRFHIRPGVTFHNGNPLTPSDVVYTFERNMIQDISGGPMWMILQPLLDTMTIRQGEGPWDLTSETDALALVNLIKDAVQVVDASGTPDVNGEYVQFNLAIPYAPFMQILSQQWSAVIDQQWASAVTWNGVLPTTGAGAVTLFATYTDPALSPFDDPAHIMMGAGPYKFKTWVVGEYWQIERNAGYYLGWPAAGSADYVSLVTEKLVEDWAPRKLLFLSNTAEQADLAPVPRANYPEIILEGGVRGTKDLATLQAGSFHMNYHVQPTALYKPYLAGAQKLDLFSDIHMRKAFSHALDFATYLSAAWTGEAIQPANPIIQGNEPFYWAGAPKANYDLDAMKAEFQLAWGGTAYASGFTVDILYNSGNTPRKTAMEMIENAIENLMPGGWPVPGSVNVIPTARAWSYILPAMYNGELPAWNIGWLADFADPHNWVTPYMHTAGDFANYQYITYGQSGHMQLGTWPFGNPALVIDNDYVDALVEEGVKRTTFADRDAIYHELQLIWYDEMPTLMTYQGLGRHWERTWVQGWYYNAILPDIYYYHLWKGLDMDMTGRDATDPSGKQKGYVDSKDVAKLNFYWFDGSAKGNGFDATLPNWRVADLWWPGRNTVPVDNAPAGGSTTDIKADTQELDDTVAGRSLSGLSGIIPSFGDGYVDIFDAARINNDWHDWVSPL